MLISVFFFKKSAFFGKNSTITQLLKEIVWELCQRFFSSFFSFCKIKVYCLWKYKFHRSRIRNSVSGLPQIGHKFEKWRRHNLPTWSHRQNFCDVTFFLFSSLVADLSFMSILWLVLESWQFLFIKNWPKIRKSEIHASKFCQISGDWGELGIPHLARMSLMKCYWILQNSTATAFTNCGEKLHHLLPRLQSRHSMNRIISKNCNIGDYEFNKIYLSCFDD